MPEYVEVLGCAYNIRRWLGTVKRTSSLQLVDIWADNYNCSPDDAVYKLASGPNLNSSTHHPRSSVYPPEEFAAPGVKRESAEPGWPLQLRDVMSTPRTVILVFSRLVFQVRLTTRVTCQPFTRQQWDKEISAVGCAKRGFRVHAGFDFGDYVLAFVSGDDTFSCDWAPTRALLPHQDVDVFSEWETWLERVSLWIEGSVASYDQNALAMNIIREADTTFAGLGWYTAAEVFFIAGLSPFLTVGELFRCPSRIARLCEAFWTFVERAHSQLPALLNPCYREFLLAPTQNQRLRFSSWLLVYRKEQTYMSRRMRALRQRYQDALEPSTAPQQAHCSGGLSTLDDIFEPTLIHRALEKSMNLGHLIFGTRAWSAFGRTSPQVVDPLTRSMQKLGLLENQGSHLDIAHYRNELFVPHDTLRKTRVAPDLYKNSNTEDFVWSITPLLPENGNHASIDGAGQSHGRPPNLRSFVPVYGREKTIDTFVYKTKYTNDVTVGPLEFHGLGQLISRNGAGRTKSLVSACKNSPIVPENLAHRHEVGLARRLLEGDTLWNIKTHTKREDSSRRGGWPKKRAADGNIKAEKDEIKSEEDQVNVKLEADGDIAAPATKRRRLHPDKRLALGMSL